MDEAESPDAKPRPDPTTRATYKTYRSGTHRTIAPADTVARLRPLMRDFGITRIADVTGLDRIGIPVVMVCRPNSRSLAVSQGKGLDLDAAIASGLMESIENYHGERIDLPLKLGSYSDLETSHPMAEVAALPRVVGGRFHEHLPMLWIEGRELISEAPRWLPYEVVHTNYTLPLPPGSGCFAATSNGLASGNHILEALSHGICEVVERDATAIWHQKDKTARDRTRLDLRSVTDEACREALLRLERAGLSVAVWDTTSDIAIPAFHCIVADDRRDGAHPGAGAGCHPVRNVALLRAVTEAVQVRTTYITGSRDDLSPEEYTSSAIAGKLRKARALMDSGDRRRDFHAVPNRESETFEDDIRWMLERLQAVGVTQVIAVDLTKEEFGLPVVRVVIPRLEGPDDDDAYVPGARARQVLEGRP